MAIEDNINEKYANKVCGYVNDVWITRTNIIQVIQKIGLCISFYDLLESSDGLIGHGTGLVNVNGQSRPILYLYFKLITDSILVKFRMIVFRPFKGEIMLGKIASGTELGIKSTFISEASSLQHFLT